MLSLVPPPAILPANGYPAGIAAATPTCLFHLVDDDELDLYLIFVLLVLELLELEMELFEDDELFELLDDDEERPDPLLVEPLPPPPPPLRRSSEDRRFDDPERADRKGTNMILRSEREGNEGKSREKNGLRK
jgi:hypothetical protein